MSQFFVDKPIDEIAAYWNARPCNLRHSAKPLASREYFDEVEARKYLVEPHIPSFADFPRWKDKAVLEIGCGLGTDTINFARHGARLTVVELSKKSLDIARRRAEVFGVADQVAFYQGDAEQLSQIIPPEKFDLIYSFGVIHHSPHPERILQELRNFTDAGTTLKLMVYHRYSWKVLWIMATYGRFRFWRLPELVATHSEAQTGCPVTYTYSRREMSDLLSRNGFRLQELGVDHIFPYRISDYIQYRYVKNWYFRWMPTTFFRQLERRFGWHLCVTAVPA